MSRTRSLPAIIVLIFLGPGASSRGADPVPRPPDVVYDLVIYGGTSGGAAAAVQAARLGKSAVLIESGRHLGGLTSGGLGATDIGNKKAIGGIAREFYRRVARHYNRDDAWTFQQRADFRDARQVGNEDTMWTFEPHVAEQIYREMIAEAKVPVLFGERLVLKGGVTKRDGRIEAIQLESGKTVAGRMFLDATYEGDLMAGAEVSYAIGREANAKFGETYNGVQVLTKHQFKQAVDPYIIPGDPASGLLAGVDPSKPEPAGTGDSRIQAYNFRMCMTTVPPNKLPWPKPEGYDSERYGLLLRYLKAGVWDTLGSIIPMPNQKTDTNNNGAISTDHIGANYAYPEGDYATRAAIFRDHVAYQQGMMYFLANDPRVPEHVRQDVARWGLCRDEFPETGGWPHQLYVREARRMMGGYIMTQHNCQRRQVVPDSVGMAAYTMDSHNCRRFVDEAGHARNEGDVQVGGFPPYPIAYRALIPKESECANLLVPVCLSATHIAYGSIRMEPVFMVLGQSAATAAVQAINRGVPVQQVDVAELQHCLRADGQVLE